MEDNECLFIWVPVSETVEAYYKESAVEDLSSDQQQELLKDLKAELGGTTKKAQKKKRQGIIDCVEAYFDPSKDNLDIKDYAQLQSEVLGNFFKDASDSRKKKWTDIFQGRSGVFTGIEECYDRFENSTSTRIDHGTRVNLVLDKMMEIIIADPTIVETLKANHDLSSQSHETQKHLFERLNTYEESPATRLAIEQLYSELWLTTNHMGDDLEMGENNTKLRNFIEHQNSIYGNVANLTQPTQNSKNIFQI